MHEKAALSSRGNQHCPRCGVCQAEFVFLAFAIENHCRHPSNSGGFACPTVDALREGWECVKGDAVVTTIVAKWEKAMDLEVLQKA